MKSKGPLTEVVSNYLRSSIEARRLRPGDEIDFASLSKKLKISRTPIRESIRKLHLEGLLEYDASGRVKVATLSSEDAEDFYAVRLELEISNIKSATIHITDYELEMLRLNLNLFEERSDKPSDLPDIDKMFHDIIYDASRNQFLSQSLKSLRVVLGLFQDPAYDRDSRISSTLKEHTAIFKALAQRDLQQAISAVTKHILNAKKARIRA